jgi:hypothetical protein
LVKEKRPLMIDWMINKNINKKNQQYKNTFTHLKPKSELMKQLIMEKSNQG